MTSTTIETIISIKELDNNDMEGYKVTTNKQVIMLLISSYRNGSEDSGYFMCNDDINDFIDSELVDISITDTELNTKGYNKGLPILSFGLTDDDTRTMFVNLKTSKGVLQFVAYNRHTGGYGHLVRVMSTQLTTDDYYL